MGTGITAGIKTKKVKAKPTKVKLARVKRNNKVFVGEEHLSKIEDAEAPGVDIETSGLSPWKDKIAVITMIDPKTDTTVIVHCRGKVSERMKTYLGSRKEMTLHNGAGFDLLFFNRYGIDVFTPKIYDTMLAELASLSSDRRDVSVSLKSSVARRVGKTLKKDQDHSGWMNPKLSESQLTYCAGDVKELVKLREAQLARADEGQLDAIAVENDLIPVVVKMSSNGLPIDIKKMNLFLNGQKKTIKDLSNKLSKDLGPLNYGSPMQIKKAMAEAGFSLPSTNAAVLQDQHMYGGKCGELCGDILELRQAMQRVKMYKPEWCEKYVIDGNVHARFWTCGTDTGRLSSSDPNLQQWPKNMRGVIGGRPGHKIVSADLSQIEIRVAAAVANCPGLLAAFNSGLHIHTDIASKSFSIPYEQVTKDFINLAKGLTFTMLFGGSWQTFQLHARQAGHDLSDGEAQKIFNDFFEAYPGVRDLKAKAQSLCRSGRPVILRLPTGLKRVLIGWKATPPRVMNTLIQGGAAAGLKYGMIECHRRGLTDYLGASVHDELVACVPDNMVKDYEVELQESMRVGMEMIMDVPTASVATTGTYWS